METPQTITIRIPRVVTRVLRAGRVGWQNAGRRLSPSPGNVVFTLLIVGLLLWAQSAGALPLGRSPGAVSSSTHTIAYQGRLADAAGAPLTGTYSIIFRLYSAASGGVPLWEEQWTGPNGVSVSDGLFNVMLGSLVPVPLAVVTGNNTLWLGVTVGTDDEMAPRVQLGSVPFAVQALTVPDGSVTTLKIADGAVTQEKLAEGIQLGLSADVLHWNGTDTSFSATGEPQDRLILPTSIVVTIPAGETHVYSVFYHGVFNYDDDVSTPPGNPYFYASWGLSLLANDQVVGQQIQVSQTGYRALWSAVGNGFWMVPIRASWLIELDSGTYTLQLKLNGYSDGTMSSGYLRSPQVQAVRLH